MRILHIDDHCLFCAGLQAYVKQQRQRDGQATEYVCIETVEGAIDVIIEPEKYDIILLDLLFAKLDGLFFLKFLRNNNSFVPVLIVSANEDTHLIKQSLNLGGNGFIHKSSTAETMFEAIQRVASGDIYIDTHLAKKLDSLPDSSDEKKPDRSNIRFNLSPREYEILELICIGLDNDNIARLLCISPNTLKTHIRHLFQELNVKNRNECMYVAIKNNLVCI